MISYILGIQLYIFIYIWCFRERKKQNLWMVNIWRHSKGVSDVIVEEYDSFFVCRDIYIYMRVCEGVLYVIILKEPSSCASTLESLSTYTGTLFTLTSSLICHNTIYYTSINHTIYYICFQEYIKHTNINITNKYIFLYI